MATIKDDAETRVSRFYGTVGWETKGEVTEDAKRWEDLREHAQPYVSACRRRVLRHVPDSGENILDMASGPIQYKEYLDYSKNFTTRYCVDLSAKALEEASKRIGDHGVFLPGSFFDLDFEEDFFDCSISLHTIYHMHKDRQEEAVRKLLYVTKPGKPVIVVYSNPHTLISGLGLPGKLYKLLKRCVGRRNRRRGRVYFYAHPIRWWHRFADVADVKILPWRAFSAKHQKRLIPNSSFGQKVFGLLFRMEERFPRLFAWFFQYPMIVLVKK
jgi:ubiquinone/menaquinone biosynthesis C-methylase UbiE